MIKQRYLCSVALIAIAFTGCPRPAAPPAAPIEPQREVPTERLSLQSSPSGARARLSTGETCVTPCTLQKDASATFTVTFEKENYRTQTVKVTNNLEVMRQYNARRGMNVDEEALQRIGTVKLVPNPVSVELEPEWSK